MDNQLFDQMYQLENVHWWFIGRRKIIEDRLGILMKNQTGRILDVGCGIGSNLDILSHYGDLVALENNKTALEYAKNKSVVDVYKGYLPDMVPDEVEGPFDLIVMYDVLEHIDEARDALKTLKRLAKPGGRLMITVPAYQFLWSKHDEMHEHKTRYTKSALTDLLDSTGWEVTYHSYFNTILFPLAVIDRIRQKLFPGKEDTSINLPPSWVNNLFKRVFMSERYLMRLFSLPFGLSILVTAINPK